MQYTVEPTHPHYVKTKSGYEIGITKEQMEIIKNAILKGAETLVIGVNVISVRNDFLGIYDKPKQDQNWKGVLRSGREVVKS